MKFHLFSLLIAAIAPPSSSSANSDHVVVTVGGSHPSFSLFDVMRHDGDVASWYGYDAVDGYPASANTPEGLELSNADDIGIAAVKTDEGISVAVIYDAPDDGSGGRVVSEITCSGEGCRSHPGARLIAQMDDAYPHLPDRVVVVGAPSSSHSGGLMTSHLWDPCCTDGYVTEPLTGVWTLCVDFAWVAMVGSSDEEDGVFFHEPGGKKTALHLGFCSVPLVCVGGVGGVVEAPIDVDFCRSPNRFRCEGKGKGKGKSDKSKGKGKGKRCDTNRIGKGKGRGKSEATSNANGKSNDKREEGDLTPITVFGTRDLDVRTIDVDSVHLCLQDDTACLNSASLHNVEYRDFGDPNFDLGADECTVIDGVEQPYLNRDGIDDMKLLWETKDIIRGLLGDCDNACEGSSSSTLVFKAKGNDGAIIMSQPVHDPGIDRLFISAGPSC